MTPGPYDYVPNDAPEHAPWGAWLVRGAVRHYISGGASYTPIAIVRAESDARAIVQALEAVEALAGCALLKEQAG